MSIDRERKIVVVGTEGLGLAHKSLTITSSIITITAMLCTAKHTARLSAVTAGDEKRIDHNDQRG
jgi:hypothetical protein